jgi:hypothetical protein
MSSHAAGEELLQRPGHRTPTEQLPRVTQPLSQGEQRRRTTTAEQAPAGLAKSASMQRPSSSPPRPAGKEQHYQRCHTTTLPRLHGRPRVVEWLKNWLTGTGSYSAYWGAHPPQGRRRAPAEEHGADPLERLAGAARSTVGDMPCHKKLEPSQETTFPRPRGRPEGGTRAAAGATRSTNLIGGVIRPKRIYFPEHFCYCFSSNLCVLNATNTD